MQGVANQRTIDAQSSYDYSVSQIKNPKNHQILGWQVTVTEKGQDSSRIGTSAENPAYILQLSNKDENGNELLTQFYKDNGIDPKNVDETKLEVQTVDDEYTIKQKTLNDAWCKCLSEGYIETSVSSMLNPFEKTIDVHGAQCCFSGAASRLSVYLNNYSQRYGADNSFYKELTEKLDSIDPEHINSAVSYIKDLISRSASGEQIDCNDEFVAADKLFKDCFGDLELGDAKKKGEETSNAFNKTLGESSIDKFIRIWSEAKSTKEIMKDLIKAFNLSDKEDIQKTATSTPTADVDLLIKQQTLQATDDENNEQMAMLKRKLDKTSVGSVVDVEM